jgi:hypothetical protein
VSARALLGFPAHHRADERGLGQRVSGGHAGRRRRRQCGGLIGLWLGRRADTSPPIASLLGDARTQASLPEVNPSLTVLNRLWPLLFSTLGAGALGFVVPQVPAIAAGFAIIWSLAWRRQSSAVTAIEERDGARFYIERTSPLQPIKLIRTPGFRSNLTELNGATASRPASPRA